MRNRSEERCYLRRRGASAAAFPLCASVCTARMSVCALAMSGLPTESARMDPGWGLAIGLILVVVNGFFVAAEFALVKLRPTQIEPLVATGDPRAKVAAHMLRHL